MYNRAGTLSGSMGPFFTKTFIDSQPGQKQTVLGMHSASNVCDSGCDSHKCVLMLRADRSVVIPESEAEQSGIGKSQVRISQEYGGGFPANVEGLHHLHCLVGLGEHHFARLYKLLTSSRIFYARRCTGTTITTWPKGKALS